MKFLFDVVKLMTLAFINAFILYCVGSFIMMVGITAQQSKENTLFITILGVVATFVFIRYNHVFFTFETERKKNEQSNR